MSKLTAQGSSLISTMAINDNKAGMEGLNKEKINQIIFEASKGSKFFENEQKKEEQLNQKILEQQILISSLSSAMLFHGLKEADELIEKLKACQDLSHTIVHVDMDAFYAAVEMRDDPRLKDKPMAVGGMSMLSTSNYIARKYGVRAAMPGFIALKLCPNLVLVEPNFTKYTAVSQEIREIFAQYDPNFSPMSLDEAYLDLTEHLIYRRGSSNLCRIFLLRLKTDNSSIVVNDLECTCDLNAVLRPSVINLEELKINSVSSENLQEYLNSLDFSNFNLPKDCQVCNKKLPPFSLKLYDTTVEDAVLEMRNRIEQRTFLTASAGIAPNTMLAKVCSDRNKPNGQFQIHPDVQEIEEFMKNLPIRKISGIGKVTEKLLGSLNISLCSDLYKQRALLYHAFSSLTFQYFMKITLGMGSTSLEKDEERKSLSTERTFAEISDPAQLYEKCAELCQHLAKDLNEEQLMGKTVSLKIKTISFEIKTRSHTLQCYTNDEKIIFNAAKQLLKVEIDSVKQSLLRLRLMGVRMSKLVPQASNQVSIVSLFHQSNRLTSTANRTNTHNFNIQKTDFDEKDFSTSINILEANDPVLESTMTTRHSQKSLFQKTQSPQKKSIESGMKNSIMKFVSKSERCSDKIANNCYVESNIKVENNNNLRNLDCENSSSTSLKLQSNSKSNFSNATMQNVSQATLIRSVESKQKTFISCPVCGQQKFDWPLDQLNQHMDLCLSRKTIKTILQDDKNSNKRGAVQVENDDSLPSVPKRKKTQIAVDSYFK
ncbi:DNA polymerase kappa [Biomphalaria glabrata]|nr:DNA polymerase kappa-like [Biomphalaria glabrata]